MDPDVSALKRLIGSSVQQRIEVADAIGFNEQTLYQVANGIPLKSGKPRSVGRKLREALDQHYPGWRDGATTNPISATPPPPHLAQALPVVLGRLPSLSAYRAGQVLAALQAAMQPLAPLEQIERDLLQWLAEPSTATSAHPAAATEKRQAQG
jgi:hypothetical protein